MSKSLLVPLDVPLAAHHAYIQNYKHLTRLGEKLLLFAGDQKVEHLNADFYGKGIDEHDNDPAHMFEIASKGEISAFATQLGLIARYGRDYDQIPYVVKMNAKTNLLNQDIADPFSQSWYSLDDVMDFKKASELPILGVGYTVYLGTSYEHAILKEAAQIVLEAHKHGLLAFLWIYPKGKSVDDPRSPEVIAGAAGVGVALGADFIKVNLPESEKADPFDALAIAVKAAGRTGLLVSGGVYVQEKELLSVVYNQLHIAGAAGVAIGRNLHQRSLKHALALTSAIQQIINHEASIEKALLHYDTHANY